MLQTVFAINENAIVKKYCNVFIILQVCDVVDRVLKSPHADILKEMNPVSAIILATSVSNYARMLVLELLLKNLLNAS